MLPKANDKFEWLTHRVYVTPKIFNKWSQVVDWLNDTVGDYGRDWTLDEVADRGYVRLRTEYQAEMFRNRWGLVEE